MRRPSVHLPGWISRGSAALLGAIFLVAAAAKAVDVPGFAGGIEAYGIITGAGATRLLAQAIVCAEAGVGACLLLGAGGRRAAVAAVGILAVFAAVSGWAWARGQQHACGCFGSLVERTPAQTLAEDALFLGLGLIALAPAAGPRAPTPRWKLHLVGAATLAAALASAATAQFAPPLAQGKTLGGLGVEEYLPWSAPQDALYGFLEPLRRGEDSAALEAVARGGFKVVALSSAEPEQIEAFRWQAGPSYDIVTVPRILVRRLSGDRRGAFFVRGGRVQTVWRGRIPAPAEVAEGGSGGGPQSACAGDDDQEAS